MVYWDTRIVGSYCQGTVDNVYINTLGQWGILGRWWGIELGHPFVSVLVY